ncbi:MAG: hypothetical protein EOO13_16510 [Chitinophagaceae bacterium]|nr:MAG: hypothetical protein EOO13_16510 [Chitinophagaceae bacterium]
MKNLLLLAISGLLLTSCQKELSFETFNPPGTTPPSTNPGTPGTTPTGNVCFTCDYSPICDGTKLNYIDSMSGTATQMNILYDILGDSTVNGAPFKKIKDVTSGQVAYFNCDNNVVRAYIASGTTAGGATVTGIMQTPLKANEPVGATWKDVIINNGQTIEYRYKIIQKNITRQVMDSTYSNVIYTRDTTVLIVPMLGELPSAVRHTWFAKGIGQVEVRMEDLMSGMTIMVRKLKTYQIR